MKKIKRKAGHGELIRQKSLKLHRENLLKELQRIRANHAKYVRQYRDMELRKELLTTTEAADEEHEQLLVEVLEALARTREAWESSVAELRTTRNDNAEFLKELDLLDEFDALLDQARLD